MTSLSELVISTQATLTSLVAGQMSILSVGKPAVRWLGHCTPGTFGFFMGNPSAILRALYPHELDLEQLNSTMAPR